MTENWYVGVVVSICNPATAKPQFDTVPGVLHMGATHVCDGA